MKSKQVFPLYSLMTLPKQFSAILTKEAHNVSQLNNQSDFTHTKVTNHWYTL